MSPDDLKRLNELLERICKVSDFNPDLHLTEEERTFLRIIFAKKPNWLPEGEEK